MALSHPERNILAAIVVASENNPAKPEFPPERPRFPATPTYRINVPGFSQVWLKDESVNPTGTHKDRMAWEIIVTYRDLLLAKKHDPGREKLPQLSLISSGSAAFAVQRMLKLYGLPNLKVLVDQGIEPKIVKLLKAVGCEIYVTDLAARPLNSFEILALTHNSAGFDITSNKALDPTTRFYDWLSYEVINQSPAYCFVPFGTGNLYENILNINKREISTQNHDPRFYGQVSELRRCQFLGASTNNPSTKASLLYSPHLPFVNYDEQWIRFYRRAGYCGNESNVFLVKEEFLQAAMDLAGEQGVVCGYSGIAGLALLLQMGEKIPKQKKVLVINTGKPNYPV